MEETDWKKDREKILDRLKTKRAQLGKMCYEERKGGIDAARSE